MATALKPGAEGGPGGRSLGIRRPGPHRSCARRAIQYEWRRLSALRSLWLVAGLITLLGVGNGVDIGLHGGKAGYSLAAVADTLQFSPLASQAPMAAFLLFPLGMSAIGVEYSHRMARTTFLTLSSRRTAYVAKVVVPSVVAAATTLGAALLGLVTGCVVLALRGDALPDLAGLAMPLLSLTVVMLCWPTLAAGLTALTRRRGAVLAFLLLWPVIVERLAGLALEQVPGLNGVRNYLPFAAARAALHNLRDESGGPDAGFDQALLGSNAHPAIGMTIFCLFTVLVAVGGGLAYIHRDAP
ncbi:hypothetical protein I5Q34_33255 [Streptomyces sp. AV19]|uniref:hypothetical protein n=1 Tax=Streptomyces sp. AV19 TaxID=2793068 RepID=UPI0018FE1357|nr:hypothetical protein [Streptomyces sp. AV19]MBH1939072.1 hypothetical protein [Streptomyces sp. AV19]MDG4534273.1 hypothetical protein [Streptomyces sp. AV19]